MLIPRWRKGALDRVCGICLIAVDRNHGKRVWKTEDLALDEGVGGQNCDSNFDGGLFPGRHLEGSEGEREADGERPWR
jgi:hypothetical protein